MLKQLIIFTGSFPYTKANEESFIQCELSVYNKYFDKVIFVPQYASKNDLKRKINESIYVDRSLYCLFEQEYYPLKSISKISKGIFNGMFLFEIFNQPQVLFSIKKLKKLLFTAAKVKLVKKWFLETEYNKTINVNNLYYTYWYNYVTTGLLSCGCKVISRAHGGDLYLYRNLNYIPFRNRDMKKIHKVYSISNYGKNYLLQEYPESSNKIKNAYIGTCIWKLNKNQKIPYKEEKFRIVSCSNLIKLKRVDFICRSVFNLVEKYKTIKFEWIHFGEGEEFDSINELAKKNIYKNLDIILYGYIPNKHLHEYFLANSVNVFINLSTTEGLPVTMQEAISYGIPLIGTNVGGVSEIIDSHTGILLNKNPDDESVLEALSKFVEIKERDYKIMQEKCIEKWSNKFDGIKNAHIFLKDVSQL